MLLAPVQDQVFTLEMPQVSGCQPLAGQPRLTDIPEHLRALDQYLTIDRQLHFDMAKWLADRTGLPLSRGIQANHRRALGQAVPFINRQPQSLGML